MARPAIQIKDDLKASYSLFRALLVMAVLWAVIPGVAAQDDDGGGGSTLTTVTLVILIIVIIILFIVIAPQIPYTVRPYEKALVERFGAFKEMVDQGLHFKWPFIDQITKMDLREQVIDVPRQEVITKDNSPTNVDAIVYIKVIDPQLAQYRVTNYRQATTALAQTTLRSVIGDMELDELLSERQRINTILRDDLDEATDPWGVKVMKVEIKEVDPVGAVKRAMEEQTSAERERRAAILRAAGEKASAILRAEGSMRSRILEAEGVRQSRILESRGLREAKILTMQGEAQALRILSLGAATLDRKALTALTLEALKSMANGQATKIIFPMEISRLINGISNYVGASNEIEESGEMEFEVLEKLIGKVEDVLGKIPTTAELDEAMKEIKSDISEADKLAKLVLPDDKDD